VIRRVRITLLGMRPIGLDCPKAYIHRVIATVTMTRYKATPNKTREIKAVFHQHSVVIEIDEEAVAVLIWENDGVTFHAVHPSTFDLHGLSFHDTVEAQRAAAAAMARAA